MNAATPVKEHANPWLAFGVVGVLQGGVYGQCTTYVSKLLGLAKKPPKLQDLLRGSAFAGSRDTISQGVPFAYTATVQSMVVDPLYASVAGPVSGDDASQPVRRMAAVMSCSIGATVASQFPHNCQIRMQAGPVIRVCGRRAGPHLRIWDQGVLHGRVGARRPSVSGELAERAREARAKDDDERLGADAGWPAK